MAKEIYVGTSQSGLKKLVNDSLVDVDNTNVSYGFITQVSDGTIYVGTNQSGLKKLVNDSLVDVDSTNVQIGFMTEIHDGTIYVGTFNQGLKKLVNDSLVDVDNTNVYQGFMTQVSDGTIYVGTTSDGLKKLVNDKLEDVDSTGVNEGFMTQVSDGTIYVGTTSDGLMKLVNDSLVDVDNTNVYQGFMTQVSDGTIYVGTFNQGLKKLVNDSLVDVVRNGVRHGFMTQVSDGTIYVGTHINGLKKLVNDKYVDVDSTGVGGGFLVEVDDTFTKKILINNKVVKSISIGNEVSDLTIDGHKYSFLKDVIITRDETAQWLKDNTVWSAGKGKISETAMFKGFFVNVYPFEDILDGGTTTLTVDFNPLTADSINGGTVDVTFKDMVMTNPVRQIGDFNVFPYVDANINWSGTSGNLDVTKWPALYPHTKLYTPDLHMVDGTEYTFTVQADHGYSMNYAPSISFKYTVSSPKIDVKVTEDDVTKFIDANLVWTGDNGVIDYTKWTTTGTTLSGDTNVVSGTEYTFTVQADSGYTVNGGTSFDVKHTVVGYQPGDVIQKDIPAIMSQLEGYHALYQNSINYLAGRFNPYIVDSSLNIITPTKDASISFIREIFEFVDNFLVTGDSGVYIMDSKGDIVVPGKQITNASITAVHKINDNKFLIFNNRGFAYIIDDQLNILSTPPHPGLSSVVICIPLTNGNLRILDFTGKSQEIDIDGNKVGNQINNVISFGQWTLDYQNKILQFGHNGDINIFDNEGIFIEKKNYGSNTFLFGVTLSNDNILVARDDGKGMIIDQTFNIVKDDIEIISGRPEHYMYFEDKKIYYILDSNAIMSTVKA